MGYSRIFIPPKNSIILTNQFNTVLARYMLLITRNAKYERQGRHQKKFAALFS